MTQWYVIALIAVESSPPPPELQNAVAHQRAGQQVHFAKNLKPPVDPINSFSTHRIAKWV
jgi:hypothetical protein